MAFKAPSDGKKHARLGIYEMQPRDSLLCGCLQHSWPVLPSVFSPVKWVPFLEGTENLVTETFPGWSTAVINRAAPWISHVPRMKL